MSTWNERDIARELSSHLLKRKCVVLLDNCRWTGHECDVLAVTQDLRIIDFEIKISRADLKIDIKKAKWWHKYAYGDARAVQREHPPKVWKHYYVVPADIWNDDLYKALPSKSSGVLLLTKTRSGVVIRELRRAMPASKAYVIKAEDAIGLARLATLRLWNERLK